MSVAGQGPGGPGGPRAAGPGLVVVWDGARPVVRPYALPPGGLVLGRELLEGTPDDRISRQHARISFNGARFVVTDLGSRNGTYASGQALVEGSATVPAPAVVRAGRTVAVLVTDVERFGGGDLVVRGDDLIGPSTRAVWARVDAAADAGEHLLLIGERGTGRGRMARAYARRRGRPEAVYNPTIQAVPLERVVGAAIETLILEEVGRLGAAAQATLLALLDARPALRVATSAPQPLAQLRIVDALVQRLSVNPTYVPPLRDRPDELPHLIAEAVRAAAPGVALHATLIEACLLRPWPGNGSELVAEVGRAAHTVAEQGKNHLRAENLNNDAGHLMLGAPTVNNAAIPTTPQPRLARRPGTTADEG